MVQSKLEEFKSLFLSNGFTCGEVPLIDGIMLTVRRPFQCSEINAFYFKPSGELSEIPI